MSLLISDSLLRFSAPHITLCGRCRRILPLGTPRFPADFFLARLVFRVHDVQVRRDLDTASVRIIILTMSEQWQQSHARSLGSLVTLAVVT